MLVGFQGMTVQKDQELRNQLREAGVSYGVVEKHAGAKPRKERCSNKLPISLKASLQWR